MDADMTMALATVASGSPHMAEQSSAQAQAQTRAEVQARVREAVEHARAAQQEAQAAQQAAQREVQAALRQQAAQTREVQPLRMEQGEAVDVPPAPTRIRVENGRVIVDGPDGPVANVGQPGTLVPPHRSDEIPPQVMEIISWAFTTIVIIALGVPLVRAFGRWLDRRGGPAPALPADLVSRLDRIEGAVETVSVEVERISEGQRFTSRLMAEMRQAPQLSDARVAEPRA